MSDIIPGFTAAEAAYDNAMPAWFEDKDLPEPRDESDEPDDDHEPDIDGWAAS